MVITRLSTCSLQWPWRRQTPNGAGTWGAVKFLIDEEVMECDAWVVFESLAETTACLCPPERTVFITGEPDLIGSYDSRFLAQFHTVVTARSDIRHPRVVRMQQGHPWHVEKTLEELLAAEPHGTGSGVCAIVSDKTYTDGHRKRLAFVKSLQRLLGDRLHVFGRGIRDFSSKWDLLSNYRYALVLENWSADDWLTEKLPDAWLAFCYPFYAGCTNVGRYFDDGGWEAVDLDNPPAAAEQIMARISDPTHYLKELPAIEAARLHYLRYVQFFPNVVALIQLLLGTTSNEKTLVTISPNSTFTAQPKSHSFWGRAARKVRRLVT